MAVGRTLSHLLYLSINLVFSDDVSDGIIYQFAVMKMKTVKTGKRPIRAKTETEANKYMKEKRQNYYTKQTQIMLVINIR